MKHPPFTALFVAFASAILNVSLPMPAAAQADPFQSAPAPQSRPPSQRASPPPQTPEQQIQQAFRTGEVRGLAGCSAGESATNSGWVGIREQREICITPSGQLTLSLDRRSPPEFTTETWRHAGVSLTCPSWPGFRLAESGQNTMTFEAPPHDGQACTSHRRLALDLNVQISRVRLACRAMPASGDRIAFEEILFRASAPDQVAARGHFVLARR